jgi:hypothetical protein
MIAFIWYNKRERERGVSLHRQDTTREGGGETSSQTLSETSILTSVVL